MNKRIRRDYISLLIIIILALIVACDEDSFCKQYIRFAILEMKNESKMKKNEAKLIKIVFKKQVKEFLMKS
jgi:hypothetical protein